MTDRIRYNRLSVPELQQWMNKRTVFYLIDTLPNDHFLKFHLPGAVNACVFQVTFLDQVKSITEDIHAVIVLYGSSSRSMDAVRAAEKLKQDGFLHVHVLEGGIKAWRSAGLTLVGDAVDGTDDPQILLSLEDGSYRIDTAQSVISWTGRNPITTHYGNIQLSSGEINVHDKNITGTLTVDMHSITNINLKGDELQTVLIAHLKSDDFFQVNQFPAATFNIISGRPVKQPYLSSPNCEIHGNLNLRGREAEHNFPVTVAQTSDNGLLLEAHFDIDRTRWNVIYGSTRYFEHLGMHLVFDLISIQMRIVAC